MDEFIKENEETVASESVYENVAEENQNNQVKLTNPAEQSMFRWLFYLVGSQPTVRIRRML